MRVISQSVEDMKGRDEDRDDIDPTRHLPSSPVRKGGGETARLSAVKSLADVIRFILIAHH